MTTLHITLKENDEIRKIVAKAFPAYNGTKVKIQYGTKSISLASYWSGGTKDEFVLIDMSNDGQASVAPNSMFDRPGYNPHEPVELPENIVVVKHTIFQGKDLGITIYSPQNAPLLADKADLTLIEQNILLCIATRKSGFRKDIYRDLGYKLSVVEEVKSGLLSRGFLLKNGAITPSGRNAITNVRNFYQEDGRQVFC